MKHNEIARRYATALFEINEENKQHDMVLQTLRTISAAFVQHKDLVDFISTPLISAKDKLSVIKNSFQGKGLNSELESLLFLLAERDRLVLLPAICSAYQEIADARSGVARGVVRSASALSEFDRIEIQKILSESTGKKVALQFLEDKNIIGGVQAQVGSLIFDDCLSTHLKRIEDTLNRSMH